MWLTSNNTKSLLFLQNVEPVFNLKMRLNVYLQMDFLIPTGVIQKNIDLSTPKYASKSLNNLFRLLVCLEHALIGSLMYGITD